MKRFHNVIWAAVAAVAALYGCAKENFPEQKLSSEGAGFHLTFTAEKAEDDVLTRAGISAEDNTVINWSEGDAISVFDGAGVNCKFTLNEGAGSPKGRFEGEVTKLADSYTVLYPYQEDATIDAATGALKGVSLKDEQTAMKWSFDPEAALMAAKSSDGSTIAFKNVVGYVKIVCGFDCREVVVGSNDYTSAIAGNVDLAFADEPVVPTSVAGTDYRSEVSLIGNIEAGAEYCIALLPCALDKGFSLTFKGTDGKQYSRSTGKSLTVKRGVVTNLGTSGAGNVELQTPYITFSAKAAQTFTFVKGSKVTIDAGLFEYSVNGGAWTSMVAGTPIAFGGADGDLRLRGKSPKGTSDGNGFDKSYNVQFGKTDVKVRCKGDIRTLIDYDNYLTADTKNARFERLFQGASPLVSAPELPMTELASYCYSCMFYETSIECAPELPATVIPNDCYSYMYNRCRQLSYSPDLKATVVGQNAYYCMFKGCKALKKAPEILATELIESNNCYAMFSWCSALEEGPSTLYAETLQDKCYAYMFQECPALKKAPVIKAVKIAGGDQHCYYMFDCCKSLEEVQDVLFAEETVVFPDMCQGMFKGCTSLKKAPELPSMNLNANCYSNMFFGCTSLTDVPESLPAMTLYERCYDSMFSGCTSLTKAPKLPAETLVNGCCNYMFRDCTSLNEIWLYTKETDSVIIRDGIGGMFDGCPSSGVKIHLNSLAVKEYISKPDWTYVDIETGEPL